MVLGVYICNCLYTYICYFVTYKFILKVLYINLTLVIVYLQWVLNN